MNVNIEYFEEVQKNSGLSYTQFWANLGRAANYQYSVLERKCMQQVIAELMCKVYDADYGKLVVLKSDTQAEAQKVVFDAKTFLIMLHTLERIEQKQNDIADALQSLKIEQSKMQEVLRELL